MTCLGLVFSQTQGSSTKHLFSLQSESVSSLIRKSWVYAWNIPTQTTNENKLFPRIIHRQYTDWKFTCLRNDQDYSRRGLHPRTEIRLLEQYSLQEAYQLNVSVSIEQFPVSFEFIQVMAYITKALPLFQLEFINNAIGVRYRENQQLWRQTIVQIKPRQKYQLQLKFQYPSFVLMMDGKLVYTYSVKPDTKISPHSFWIQFGVYKNKVSKVDQTVTFHSLDLYRL